MIDMDKTYSTKLDVKPVYGYIATSVNDELKVEKIGEAYKIDALQACFEVTMHQLHRNMEKLGYPKCTIKISIKENGSDYEIDYR